jgi:hypothetical protein
VTNHLEDEGIRVAFFLRDRDTEYVSSFFTKAFPRRSQEQVQVLG